MTIAQRATVDTPVQVKAQRLEHDLPIARACQIARLSRAAYYRPGVDQMARDVEMIAALQAIVVEEQR